VTALRDILAREQQGRGQVSVVVTEPAREIEIKLPGAWTITAKSRAAINALPGIVEVQEL
jgi:DNA polymerase III subunit alpha